MKTVFAVVLMLFVATTAFAGSIWDSAAKFIVETPKQASLFYNFDQREINELVGITVAEDVFVPNLDIAANYNFNESLIATVDYTFKKGGAITPFVQAGVGLHRIEKLENNNIGEIVYGLGGGIKF